MNIEDLIARVRRMRDYATDAEVADKLIHSGVEAGLVWLVLNAAKILDNN